MSLPASHPYLASTFAFPQQTQFYVFFLFFLSSFRRLVRFLSVETALPMNLIKNFAKEYRLHILCLSANFELYLSTFHTIAAHSTKIPQRIFCDILCVIELSHILEQMAFCSVLYSFLVEKNALIAISKATNEAPPDEFNATHVLKPKQEMLKSSPKCKITERLATYKTRSKLWPSLL